MVALAIVAISLAAGSRAASSVVDTSQRLTDVVLAQWCADNQLTEMRLPGQLPAVGKTTFTCAQLGRDFKGTHQGAAHAQPELPPRRRHRRQRRRPPAADDLHGDVALMAAPPPAAAAPASRWSR